MAKVIVQLRVHEFAALNDLAQQDGRAPEAQAAPIIPGEPGKPGMVSGGRPAQSTSSGDRITPIQEKV